LRLAQLLLDRLHRGHAGIPFFCLHGVPFCRLPSG
jgi:hypothetical protein